MLEYFPEPEEAKADSHCENCGKALFVGDTIADDEAYICKGCMAEWALNKVKRGVLIEFITSNNLEEDFSEWLYADQTKEL